MAVRGVAVITASQLLRMATQILSVIVLARLLTPVDYGLVAMVLSVIGVGELFRDMGLSTAAIRADTLAIRQRDNLFWINTGMGFALCGAAIACAPLIARLFDQTELVAITYALSTTFVLTGLSTQYRVDLTRDLKFGRLAAVDLACSVVPLAIGVVAALAGLGYWALVIQQISSGVIGLVLLVALCRWLPRGYHRDTSVTPLVRLGGSFLFSGLLGYVIRNADSFVVGRRFGAESLGLYSRSVQLVRTPLSQLQVPFGTVVLPILAAARDDDERLMRAAVRAQVGFTYPVLTGVALIVAMAPDVVLLTLGQQWLEAAPVMAFIAVSGGLTCVAYAVIWLFAARALAATMNKFNVLATVDVLVCILVGTRWGVDGVAAGLAVASAIGWPMALFFLSRGSGLPVSRLAWPGIRAVSTTAVAGLVAYLAWTEAAALPLLGRLGVGTVAALVMMAAATLVPAVRGDYHEVVKLLDTLRRRA